VKGGIGSLLALAMAASAGAADLNIGVSGGMEYDSQAVQDSGEQGDDFGFRVSPTLRLRDDYPRLRYQALYQPSYVQYVTTSRDEDVDHLGSLRLDYTVGPRTQLTFDERLTWFRRFFFETFEAFDSAGNVVNVADDTLTSDRTFRNDASLALEHLFSKRLRGSSLVAWGVVEAEADDQFDSQSVYTASELSYGIDDDTRVGGGAAYTFQAFDSVDEPFFQPGSESYIYEAFASASRRFAQIWTFTLRGGPSLIASRSTFPLAPGQVPVEAERWTFFGAARLSARWSETLDSYASYRRSQDDSSGEGRTSIRDAVSLYTAWRPSELWNLSLLGEWVQRKRAVSEDRLGIDSTRWSLSGNASRQITRRTSVGLHFFFNRQDDDETLQTDAYNEYLVLLDFRYDFDPIRLWH
jgi:hypothetical protein